MGCNQSTVKEQVQETTTPAAPVSGEPVANDAAQNEVPAQEVAPVAEEVTEEAPAAEETAEEAPATDEQQAEAVAEEIVAEVAEAVVEAEVEAPAPAEANDAEVENADSTDAAASETVAEEPQADEEATATAPEEPAAEEAAPTEEAPVVAETAATEAEPAAEPQAEEPAAEEAKTPGAMEFVSSGVTFGEKGVAYYNIKGASTADPAKEVTLRKRYNDFKALHAHMAKLMANAENVADDQKEKFATYPALPALPRASLKTAVKRRNAQLLKEREEQFLLILNDIARHPVAFESDEFQAFLA